MPCKDPKESYFREALDSVFSQSAPSWNLFVIYDTSDDLDRIGLLRELNGRGDHRLRLLQNESRAPRAR